MNSLVITPKSKSDMKLITDLMKKMNVEVKVLTPEEREDAGLLLLMKEAEGSSHVSRASIMKKLNAS